MSEKTLVCGRCGAETFYIKFDHQGNVRAVCSVCGRQTSAVGGGPTQVIRE